MVLKEQAEELLRQNAVLRRAVAIQHERQKDYDERNQELQQLKHLVSQYQEQIKTLEVNPFSLFNLCQKSRLLSFNYAAPRVPSYFKEVIVWSPVILCVTNGSQSLVNFSLKNQIKIRDR